MYDQQPRINMVEYRAEQQLFEKKPKTKEQIRLDQMGRLLNIKVKQLLWQKDKK